MIYKLYTSGNNYLIIKLDNKRKIKSKINLDEEIEILIQKETDRQLNQYSINFFNKLKKIFLFMNYKPLLIVLGEPRSVFIEIFLKLIKN